MFLNHVPAVPVSVLMPVRNGGDFFARAREGIELNTRSCDQIILINDGSSDSTEGLMSSWADEDDRVLFINSGGIGLVRSLNLGIKESSHNWIARFDVDDAYRPNRLEMQRALANESNVAVFCDYQITSVSGQNLGTIPSPVAPFATSISLIHSQRTPHPGSLYSKEAFISAGRYRQEDFPAEDLSLWLRMSRLGNLVSVPQVLLDYRVHPSSVTSTNSLIMEEKKRELLRLIGVNQSDLIDVKYGIEESLLQYLEQPFRYERSLLLAYDFLAIPGMKNSVNELKKTLFSLSLLPKNYSMLKSAVNLVSGKVLRDNYYRANLNQTK